MGAMLVRSGQLADFNRPTGFKQRISAQHGFRMIETVSIYTNVKERRRGRWTVEHRARCDA
jgi:hypothetical protein